MHQVLIADDYRMIRETFSRIVEDAQKAGRAFEVSGTADNDGIKASAAIKSFSPQTKIVLVTSMPEESFLERAREAGAESFWNKELLEQPLIDVMVRTMAGESVYPSSMPAVWFGNTVSTNLTDRETDVLRGLVTGKANAEIAAELGISERSVKAHITDMLNKTGFKSRLQLAVRARAGGLVINDSETE